jgi:hypothetical protein
MRDTMSISIKGTGPVSAEYAKGGPSITTKSRFLKTPNQFTTDAETGQDYEKKSPGGELAVTKGDNKSKTPIKPRT